MTSMHAIDDDGESFEMKIGDLVFFSFSRDGFSGNIGANGALGSTVFAFDDSERSSDAQGCVFSIHPALRYSSQRALQKFTEEQKDLDGQKTQKREEKELKQNKAIQEKELNEAEAENLQGQKVSYGMPIQLLHVKTGKYLTCTDECSDREVQNMVFELKEEVSKRSHFVLMPVQKMLTTGQPVQYGTQLQISSNFNRKTFVHVSESLEADGASCEVNLSAQPSAFVANCFADFSQMAHSDHIQAGNVISLFYSEQEAFLTVPTEWEKILHKLGAHDERSVYVHKTDDEGTNSGQLWIIEKESPFSGGDIQHSEPCRLKHAARGLYLCINESTHEIGLTDKLDKSSLLALAPVSRGCPIVEQGSLVCIQPFEDRSLWLHADGKSENGFILAQLAPLKHPNAFKLEKMYEKTIALDFMSAIKPILAHLSAQYHRSDFKTPVSDKFIEAAKRLIVLLTPSPDENDRSHVLYQSLAREFGILTILVSLVQTIELCPDVSKLKSKSYSIGFHLVLEALKFACKDCQTNAWLASGVLVYLLDLDQAGLNGLEPAMDILHACGAQLNLPDGFVQQCVALALQKDFKSLALASAACATKSARTQFAEVFFSDAKNCLMGLELRELDEKTMTFDLFVSGRIQGFPEFCLPFSRLKKAEDKKLVRFLEEQIHFFTVLVEDQDETTSRLVRDMIPLHILETTILDHFNLPYALRAHMCLLMKALYICNRANRPLLDLPSFVSLSEIEGPPLAKKQDHDTKVSSNFLYELTHSMKLCSPHKSDAGHNLFNRAVLDLGRALVAYGYYEFKSLFSKNAADRIYEYASNLKHPVPHGIRRDSLSLVVDSKCKAVEILEELSKIKSRSWLSTFLRAFALYRKVQEENSHKELIELPKDGKEKEKSALPATVFAELEPVFQEMDLWIQIKFESGYGDTVAKTLVDSALTDSQVLGIKALKVFNSMYTQREALWNRLNRIQILNDEQTVLSRIFSDQVSFLKHYLNEGLPVDKEKEATTILRDMITVLRDPQTSKLYSELTSQFDLVLVLKDACKLLPEHKNECATPNFFREFFAYMKELANHSTSGQELIFEHYESFIPHMGKSLGVSPLLECVFKDNRSLCMRVGLTLISTVISLLGKRKQGGLQYISLLKTLVQVKGNPLPRNQMLVLKAVMKSFNDIVKGFTQGQWLFLLGHKIKNGTHLLEPYHTRLLVFSKFLGLIAACCLGKNKSAESMCQEFFKPMFPFRLLMESSKDFDPLFASVTSLYDTIFIDSEQPNVHPTDFGFFLPILVQKLYEYRDQLSTAVEIAASSPAGHFSSLSSGVNLVMTPDGHSSVSASINWEEVICVIKETQRSSPRLPLVFPESDTALLTTRNNSAQDKQLKNREELLFGSLLPLFVKIVKSEAVDQKVLENNGHADRLDQLRAILEDLTETMPFDSAKFPLVQECFTAFKDKFKIESTKSVPTEPAKKPQPDTGMDKTITNQLKEFIKLVQKEQFAQSVSLPFTEQLTTNLIRLCRSTLGQQDEDFCAEASRILCKAVQKSQDEDEAKRQANLRSFAAASAAQPDVLEKTLKSLGDSGVVDMVLGFFASGSNKLTAAGFELASCLLEHQALSKPLQKLFHDKLQVMSSQVFEQFEVRFQRAENEIKARKRMQKKLREIAAQASSSEREEVVKRAHEKMEENIDKSHLILELLRFLQLLCEGHNSQMQTFLSHQPSAPKSFNFVRRVLDFVTVEKSTDFMDDRLCTLWMQAFCTLTEFVQGPCLSNQLQLGVSSFFVCANFFLGFNEYFYPDAFMNDKKILLNLIPQIQGKVLITLLSLLEGGKAPSIPKTMLEVLDLPSLSGLVDRTESLKFSLKRFPNKEADIFYETPEGKAQKKQLVETEQLAYILLSTLEDFETDSLTTATRTKKSTGTGGMLRRLNVMYPKLKKRIGQVEVEREGELERVYFPIPKMCDHLPKTTKKEFPYEIDQDESSKIRDFVDKSEVLVWRMELDHKFHQSHFLRWLFRATPYVFMFAQFLAFIINVIMMDHLRKPILYDEEGELITSGDKIIGHSVWTHSGWGGAVEGLGATLFACFLYCTTVYICRDARVEHQSEQKRLQTAHKFQNAKYVNRPLPLWLRLWNKPFIYAVVSSLFFLIDDMLLYYIASLAFAMLGIVYQPAFFVFHLTSLFFGSRHASSVIKAVTKNGVSLITTAVLGLIVIWGFSMFAFIFFSDEFTLDGYGPVCQTAGSCFSYIINFGIRGGGFWEGSNFPFDSRPSRQLWNMVFVIAINIILLNMIFGIIIDTFGQLRDEKSTLSETIASKCFICNIPKSEFDRFAEGLEAHQENDHNLWNYLFFMMYLRQDRKESEFTGTEQYVWDQMKHNQYAFFPQGKALALKHVQDKLEDKKDEAADEDESASRSHLLPVHRIPHAGHH